MVVVWICLRVLGGGLRLLLISCVFGVGPFVAGLSGLFVICGFRVWVCC